MSTHVCRSGNCAPCLACRKCRYGACACRQSPAYVGRHRGEPAPPRRTDRLAWPFNIDNPARAVHFMLERECPYGDPSHCPNEVQAAKVISAYIEYGATRA